MTRLIQDDCKLRVRVCTGMHCSSGGGGHPLFRAIQQALTDAGAADQVDMYTAHCLGECPDGPCVRVGMERFYRIGQEDVPALVQDEILPRIKR